MADDEIASFVWVFEKVHLGHGWSLRSTDYRTRVIPSGDKEGNFEEDGKHKG